MQKETVKERVYRGIYEAVTNGEYKSNDILTENQMIEKFGVSKSPVREALVELCKDGILTNIPRMGYQVRAVTLKEIIDILEFRVDVELGGLRKSFPILTEENIAMLRQIAERHSADIDRVVFKNWQRNYEFHTSLYSLNNNVYGCEALYTSVHATFPSISCLHGSGRMSPMAVIIWLLWMRWKSRILNRPVSIWKKIFWQLKKKYWHCTL